MFNKEADMQISKKIIDAIKGNKRKEDIFNGPLFVIPADGKSPNEHLENIANGIKSLKDDSTTIILKKEDMKKTD